MTTDDANAGEIDELWSLLADKDADLRHAAELGESRPTSKDNQATQREAHGTACMVLQSGPRTTIANRPRLLQLLPLLLLLLLLLLYTSTYILLDDATFMIRIIRVQKVTNRKFLPYFAAHDVERRTTTAAARS